MSVFEKHAGVASELEDSSTQFSNLQEHVARMASVGPQGQLLVPDNYHRAFYQSLSNHLGNPDYPVFNSLVREDLALHPVRLPVNVGNLYLRDNQDFILRTEQPFSTHPYPYGYDNPRAWESRYTTLEVSRSEQEHFRINSPLNVRTTIPDRGLLVKASALLMGREGPLRMLDIGCSRNHVAKKLAYYRRRHFPYGRMEIVDSAEDGTPSGLNREATETFNRLLNQDNLPVSQIVGMDIQDLLIGQDTPMAQKIRLWDRHCFYPSEYRHNSERIFDFDLFEAMDLDEVEFYQADVTDPEFDHDRFGAAYKEQPKADVAYFSTIAHQLGQEGTETAVKNVRRHLKPDAVLMITEFVRTMSSAGVMEWSPDRAPFSYKHYVLDLSREEDGWQELIVAESGRVRRGMLTRQAARLASRQGIDLQLSY